jgi:AraC-like DNA-binding protein
MDNTKNIAINWSSADVLEEIIQNIKKPLENIIAVSKHDNLSNRGERDEIVFSSSKEIGDIVEEMLIKAREKSLKLTFQERPDIFNIYESNTNVRKMCSGEINPQKITKQDQHWLMNLEKEVYGSITQEYLDLYELSYRMAISERQLHRKIVGLVYLTPNKYIRVLRLHKAKQLIDNYIDRSISQIAYTVGYNDVHYFSKLFTDQYSVSPKDLLRAYC